MNNKILPLILLCMAVSFSSHGQKRMDRSVNAYNERDINPTLTADGKTMLMMRKYRVGAVWHMMISRKTKAGWTKPLTVDAYNDYVDMYGKHGFFLTYDGKGMYFSSRKRPGVGRYDVVYAEFNNGKLGEIVNFGKPINSLQDEGCPSVTADGKTMYFVKGTANDEGLITGKIYVAKRRGKESWSEPVEIKGAGINTGFETKPVILPDGQTLVFASSRSGGKGGFDLYMTRLENGSWSSPVPLDFMNTSDDDTHASIPALGNVAYGHQMHEEESIDLYMYKVPEELQQGKLIMAYGKVFDGNKTPVKGFLSVFDNQTGRQIQKVKLDKEGEYFTILNEGKMYDLFFYSSDGTKVFTSRNFDATDLDETIRSREKIQLDNLNRGTSFVLNNVKFDYNSTDLGDFAEGELNRLAKFMQKNASTKFKIKVELQDYRESDEPSNELSEEKESEDGTVVYHNDRTEQQAEVIKEFLVGKGVSEDQISFENVAVAIPEQNRLNTVEINVTVE